MELTDAIQERRSIRNFKDKDVPEVIINKLIKYVSFAPSACNLQPWYFIGIKNKDTIKRIVEEGEAQNQILKAPYILVTLYNKEVTKENYANIQSCAAAIQNLCLSAYSLNLGTLWVTGFHKPENIKKILKIPHQFEILAIILLGYPLQNKINPPKRKKIQEIYSNEFFENKNLNFPATTILREWNSIQVKQYQKQISRRGFELEKIGETNLNQIVQRIKQKLVGEILDFYSYSGNFLVKLQEEHKIAGYFGSKEIFEAAKIYNKELTNKNYYTEKIPPKRFDTITSFYKFEHLPEKKEFFKEIKNLLKENGTLLIITRNKNSWRGIWDFWNRTILKKKGISDNYFHSLNSIGPWELFTKKQIKRILKENNFKIVHIKALFVSPLYELENTNRYKNYRLIKSLIKIFYPIEKIFTFWGETLIVEAKNEPAWAKVRGIK